MPPHINVKLSDVVGDEALCYLTSTSYCKVSSWLLTSGSASKLFLRHSMYINTLCGLGGVKFIVTQR